MSEKKIVLTRTRLLPTQMAFHGNFLLPFSCLRVISQTIQSSIRARIICKICDCSWQTSPTVLFGEVKYIKVISLESKNRQSTYQLCSSLL